MFLNMGYGPKLYQAQLRSYFGCLTADFQLALALGRRAMSKWRSVSIIVLASLCGAAYTGECPRAQEPTHATEQPSPAADPTSQLCRIDIRGEKKDQWMRLPKPESSVTEHRFVLGGKSFDYTATAGTLIIRDDEDKPIAGIGYVAYVRHDLKGGGARPLMFAFNGGPGSSSLWLHMGVLGPKRVVVSDPGPTPAGPYRTVDNEFGVLDKSDLVMIDPVGTGLSHAVCDHKDNEFWAVDPDIDSLSRFIADYVSDNNRWTCDGVRHGASGLATGAGRAHRDEVLRGRPHDVRAFAVDGENEARPRRVHRLNRAAMSQASRSHKALEHQTAQRKRLGHYRQRIN